MFTKFKKFYHDHQEAIIASAISSACTATGTAIVLGLKIRQYKITNLEIRTPVGFDEQLKVIEEVPMAVRLYFANGGTSTIEMVTPIADTAAAVVDLTVVE